MKRLKQLIVISLMLAATGYQLSGARVEAKVWGGPPLGFTGAPGEGTCIGCHYTFGMPNPPNSGGNLEISGLPESYTPGASYTVTITLSHPTAQRWGFEVTAIDETLSSNGAGTLELIDNVRTAKRESDASGYPRIYISHFAADEQVPPSEDGTYPGKTGSNSWSFTWIAPASGDVTFYAVGNAANYQVSPEDDYIYTTSFVTRAPNSAPLFTALADRTLAPGDRISFTVSATDPEGSPLTFSASPLANSTFDPVTRRFTFTAAEDQEGEHEVTFTASDGSLEATKTVNLTVKSEGPALLAGLDKTGEGDDYLDYASASGLEIAAIGEFGAGASLLFNGLELPLQQSALHEAALHEAALRESALLEAAPLGSGAPAMTAAVPASELAEPGAYVVRVKLGDGTLTNARHFALASSINAQAAAIVDAARYGSRVAPGQIAALFGTDLIVGEEPDAASTVPLPVTLRGATAYVNGVAAPLFFAGAGQINLQLPRATAVGEAEVVVLREDGIAARGTIEVAEVAPAIFTLNSSGTGQAAAINGDFTFNGDESLGSQFKRVRRGEFIIIYATGTGTNLIDAMTGAPVEVADGTSGPAGQLVITSISATATIGGAAAPVTFSGLAPGFVGLWQINIQTPANAPAGAAVELVINYGGQTSNQVMIAVE